MACGTAVVATDTEGAKELLRDHELLVEIKEPVKLSKKICVLLEDAESRKRLGLKVQKIARENFSLERMLSETEELYRQL